jgi:hypothetical protein
MSAIYNSASRKRLVGRIACCGSTVDEEDSEVELESRYPNWVFHVHNQRRFCGDDVDNFPGFEYVASRRRYMFLEGGSRKKEGRG